MRTPNYILKYMIFSGIMLCGSCGHYPESILYLARDSELPVWIIDQLSSVDNNARIDGDQLTFEFYGSSTVCVTYESSVQNIKLKGEYHWIDPNVGGAVGTYKYFSITIKDKSVIFRQEVGRATFIRVVQQEDIPGMSGIVEKDKRDSIESEFE